MRGRGGTTDVKGNFRIGHVCEDPEVIVVTMGVEGDLLLIGATGVHVIV